MGSIHLWFKWGITSCDSVPLVTTVTRNESYAVCILQYKHVSTTGDRKFVYAALKVPRLLGFKTFDFFIIHQTNLGGFVLIMKKTGCRKSCWTFPLKAAPAATIVWRTMFRLMEQLWTPEQFNFLSRNKSCISWPICEGRLFPVSSMGSVITRWGAEGSLAHGTVEPVAHLNQVRILYSIYSTYSSVEWYWIFVTFFKTGTMLPIRYTVFVICIPLASSLMLCQWFYYILL